MNKENINIVPQIERLLAQYGVARVPGLGVFTLERRNASLRSNQLLPPGDVVVFTEDRNCQNDNMLAEQVMRDYKVSFAEARAMVSQAAEFLDVPSVCGWKGYLPQNLGLRSLYVTEIRHEGFVREIGKYAAIVAVAMIMNLAVPFNGVNDENVTEASFAPELLVSVSAEEETVVEEEVAAPKEFCVIVSSLVSRQDAVNWILAHDLGETAEVVECNGHFRVSAERFETYDDAERYIRDNGLKAWVFHDVTE